jgi:serine/threonine protein kinase
VGERRVGSYQIERVLARGGMAVVYLARQPMLDRWVALKRLDLTSGDPSLAQRFVDEARVVARLDHPNVVTVHDLLEHDGTPYIAMEYVSGGSLRPMIGQLDAVQVIGVLDDVLAGLAHAAEHGVTHRDLKPENVLVTPRGTCKIADFGIAIAHDAVTRLTSTGTALGTPVYMAPEQARGDGVDPRTDLYALGVMAYELLAGTPPFPGDDAPLSVLYRHVHDAVPPLEPAVPDAPAQLVPWVEALLAKAPGDRPPGAAAARRALEELAVAPRRRAWRQRREPAARVRAGHDGPAV